MKRPRRALAGSLALAAVGALAQCAPFGDTTTAPSTGGPADAGTNEADAEAGALDGGTDTSDAGGKIFPFEDGCWAGENAVVAPADGRTGSGCAVCRQNPGSTFAMSNNRMVGHTRAGITYSIEAWVFAAPKAGLTTWIEARETSSSSPAAINTTDGTAESPSSSWQKITGQLKTTAGGDVLGVLVMGDLEAAGSVCFVVDDVTVFGPLD